MIGFCKKSVHSLFNCIVSTINNVIVSTIATSPVNISSAVEHHHRHTPSPVSSGLSILTAEIPKPNNVIESSSKIKSQSKLIDVIDQSNVIESCLSSSAKRESGGTGLGFLDGGSGGGGGDGGDIDGFASCTESLGFESSNERSSINEFENEEFEKIRESSRSRVTKKSRNGKKEVKKFPPPLSSFTEDGKPSFYLMPVRKDGRLELIKVMIHRPEALRASRGDGRLRLHLVEDQATNQKNDEQAHASEDQIDVKGKKVEDGRQFPANSGGGGGEDCRHEMAVIKQGQHQHQQQHNMHGWGHRCVTIR